ncbi:MAG: WecB/TagA/CpsF family glycosyltransferase [Spirochaetales bacterium]|nr:WecB/TagA/CpsF family glycosyltransferase [Spirochaetales bacterium]MBR6062400.1 WecB/TagA/CpsF family glycosyltransferase [Spirochaetales bacterium]
MSDSICDNTDGRINIGGLLFDNVDMDETVVRIDDIIRAYRSGRTQHSAFGLVANQDIINKKKLFPDMSDDVLNRSALTFPDGYSIVVASKMLGTPLKCRVAGPDLMWKVVTERRDYSHFFLGAADGVAQKMADRFRSEFGDIKVAGIYTPPFCAEFTSEENDKMIDMINRSECDILWVSFGCPKQERWIVNNIERLRVPITLGVGAAFDFHSGNVKRAPLWMQNMKLEWLFRITQSPKRLFGRYFNGGITFYRTIKHQKKMMKKQKLSNIKEEK